MLKNLVRDLAVTVLMALMVSAGGVVWINYDIPGVWPTWLGPLDVSQSPVVPHNVSHKVLAACIS